MASSFVDTTRFYYEWSGHQTDDLHTAHKALRRGKDGSDRNILFLAGDSSLDNKYWILHRKWAKAINGYEHLLRPPTMVRDVSYWMNKEIVKHNDQSSTVCLNTSIEATTLAERKNELLPQDEFIRDNIRRDDALIVSIGGNDIALRPSASTIWNMLRLVMRSKSTLQVEKGTPENELPGGYSHFIRMFRDKITRYIERITETTRPKTIIVCLIYYPDEKTTGSWADTALGCMGYNKDPEKLQILIRSIFEIAVRNIQIEGTNVVAFPLFEYLDGKDTKDYEQRVEPSVQGGEKMAKGLYAAYKGAVKEEKSGGAGAAEAVDAEVVPMPSQTTL